MELSLAPPAALGENVAVPRGRLLLYEALLAQVIVRAARAVESRSWEVLQPATTSSTAGTQIDRESKTRLALSHVRRVRTALGHAATILPTGQKLWMLALWAGTARIRSAP